MLIAQSLTQCNLKNSMRKREPLLFTLSATFLVHISDPECAVAQVTRSAVRPHVFTNELWNGSCGTHCSLKLWFSYCFLSSASCLLNHLFTKIQIISTQAFSQKARKYTSRLLFSAACQNLPGASTVIPLHDSFFPLPMIICASKFQKVSFLK